MSESIGVQTQFVGFCQKNRTQLIDFLVTGSMGVHFAHLARKMLYFGESEEFSTDGYF